MEIVRRFFWKNQKRDELTSECTAQTGKTLSALSNFHQNQKIIYKTQKEEEQSFKYKNVCCFIKI